MISVNGMATIIKVIKEGDDKNGDKYASFSAVFRSEDGDKFVILRAFRKQAEFILRNLGDSPRRAQVSGRLSLQEQTKSIKIEKKLKIDGKVYKASFDHKEKETVAVVMLNDIEFIDKKKDAVIEVEEMLEADDSVVVIECEVE